MHCAKASERLAKKETPLVCHEQSGVLYSADSFIVGCCETWQARRTTAPIPKNLAVRIEEMVFASSNEFFDCCGQQRHHDFMMADEVVAFAAL